MERLKRLKPLLTFHLGLNVLVVVFITGASYYNVPLEGVKDRAIYLVHLCLLQSTVAGFLYFLSLSKWLFRIVFPALFFLYSCFSFWAYTQDISITPSLIQAVLETRPDIAADLLTLPYLLFLIAVLGALTLVLKKYNRLIKVAYPGRALLLLPAILCIALLFVMESRQKGIFTFRLPYNLLTAVGTYYQQPDLVLNQRLPEVVVSKDSIRAVLVLGETVRADHLGLNGYERNTTPLLGGRDDVISYAKLCTDHTYTATSVPQILTDQLLNDEQRPFTSLYAVAAKAGYRSSWVGNQSLEKSYEPVVWTNDEVILVDKYRSVFSFEKERDEVMLPILDSLLPLNQRQLITLHMIGSHWWYESRYPEEFRKYQPVIDSKYIPSLTAEQVVNSYDNTIVYLDHFLHEIITSLEDLKTPTVMVYISDHGELLGEEGKWLHAQSHQSLTNPAFIMWFSEAYRRIFPERVQMYRDKANKDITTDEFFPDMLDILNISWK